MASSLSKALGVVLYVEIKVKKALEFVRPVAVPLMRIGQVLAYAIATMLGFLQVALTLWDALMLVVSGAPASCYGSMLGEHDPVSWPGFFIALIYWSPLAYGALFFCFARILQYGADWYRDADLRFRFSFL